MRSERPPLPLLLAATAALWALALAVAAYCGLGSALPAAQGDGVAPQTVPPLPQPLPERLGSLADYPQVSARPVFNENRRPQPYFVAGSEQVAGSGLRLTGVMLTPQANIATLSGDGGLSIRLRQGGAAVQGWQLLELSPRQATVLGPDGSQILLLQVYDGSADTAAAAPGPADATAPAAAASVARQLPRPPPPPPAAQPAAASTPRAAEAPGAAAAQLNANANEPSAAQMQAIRERIQARRLEMQKNHNGQNPGQNR